MSNPIWILITKEVPREYPASLVLFFMEVSICDPVEAAADMI